MDDKNGKNPLLALTVATVLFAALGVIVYSPAPYKGIRPSVPPVQEPSEKIRARLWQDPFQAILDGVKEKSQTLKSVTTTPSKTKTPAQAQGTLRGGVIDLSEPEKLKGTLWGEIDTRLKTLKSNEKITILGVMVFGGPYAELVESRLRQRYAVLSALNILHFYPQDPEHLGYLKIKNKKYSNESEALSNIIPYEWLAKENQAEPVLLLWLNEDSFYSPLFNLACLKGHFSSLGNKLSFKLIGPPSSTTLLNMIKEPINSKFDNLLSGLEIYCASATADYPFLFPEIRKDKEDISIQRASARENIIQKFKGQKVTFRRTICSDGELIEELIEELRRRGVDLLAAAANKHDHKKVKEEKGQDIYGGHRDHAVLVCEWDTDYGRLLPKTFLEVLKEKHNNALKNDKIPPNSLQYLSQAEDIKWVRRFSYLRGIDGKLPGEQNGSNREQKKNDGDKKEKDITNLEEPVGKSQYDYLRRLAERIDRLDDKLQCRNQGSIKAIGVLGNDFYDKFLVLQALEQRFPEKVFFTTDLDANYFHPANIKWTRNLVVASTYGLQLREDLQVDVPPFRDGYQSSAFFATLRAFYNDDGTKNQNNPLKQEDISRPLKPHIFEIGWHNAIDLSAENNGKDASNKPVNEATPLQSSLNINRIHLLILGVVLLLLSILLWLSCNWDFNEVHFFKSIKQFFTNKITILSIITILLIVSSVIYLKIFVLKDPSEEPFFLMEGISVWPTEIIRLIAIILSCLFIFLSISMLNTNKKTIYHDFCLKEDCKKTIIFNWSRITSVENPINVNVELEKNFKDFHLLKRFLLVIVVSLVYFIFCGLIIMLFEKPTVPVCGEISRNIDIGILMVSIFLILLLTFFVLDTIMVFRRFISQFYTKQPQWNLPSLVQFTKKWINEPELPQWMGSKAEEALSNWMLIQVIAKRSDVVGKLIFFPFIVWFLLMFVARHYYFDNWRTPLGLAIVISMSPVLAWGCAVYLRHSAEKLRTVVSNHLAQQMIGAYAAEPLRKTDADRIQYVLNEVKGIKTGAFASYIQQPVLQSLLVPLGGISGLKILELLTNLG